MITETLESHTIPLSDCRAQGYANAASMSDKYNSAQPIINNSTLLLYSLVATHTIYLCDNDATECIPEASTYFGTIQTICILFSCSLKRWEILAKRIGFLLHGISGNRWSDQVNSVKPFVAHLSGVTLTLEKVLELNITPKTRKRIHGAMCYCRSFTGIIVSVVWHKILVPIDFCNNVIQASDATLHMEVANIESLLAQLVAL